MIWLFQMIAATILFCPFIALLLLYMIGKKMKLATTQAFGYAADVATPILFLSVSLAIKGIWQVKVLLWMIILAMVVAMIFTYSNWRTEKEIEVAPLLRRIWRFYFIALVILYFAVIVIGITISVLDYVKVV
ncbi:MAG: DUF3397 domain-containing protein [Solibacillus sp.]